MDESTRPIDESAERIDASAELIDGSARPPVNSGITDARKCCGKHDSAETGRSSKLIGIAPILTRLSVVPRRYRVFEIER